MHSNALTTPAFLVLVSPKQTLEAKIHKITRMGNKNVRHIDKFNKKVMHNTCATLVFMVKDVVTTQIAR